MIKEYSIRLLTLYLHPQRTVLDLGKQVESFMMFLTQDCWNFNLRSQVKRLINFVELAPLETPFQDPFWSCDRNLPEINSRFFKCLVSRPVTRSRHIRKLEGFISRRINAIVCGSLKPNWSSIASNVVRSSHAISRMRSIVSLSISGKSISTVKLTYWVSWCNDYLVGINSRFSAVGSTGSLTGKCLSTKPGISFALIWQ